MKTEELVQRVRALSGQVKQRRLVAAEKKSDLIDPIWMECQKKIENLASDPLAVLRNAEQQPRITTNPKYRRYELSREILGFDVQMIVYEDLDGFGVKKAWYIAFNDKLNTSYVRYIGV